MISKYSLNVDEALKSKLITLGDNSIISPSVRIILKEDDGKDYGIINIGSNTIVRDGVVICSGVKIGNNCLIGHMSIIRKCVNIGDKVTISHLSSIERDVSIGNNVRISALTHITGSCIIEDNVQIGARVVTINDNSLSWGSDPELTPCIFRANCKIGSGTTIMGGVEIGASSIVGAGSLVLKNIPDNVVAYGHPSYVQRDR